MKICSTVHFDVRDVISLGSLPTVSSALMQSGVALRSETPASERIAQENRRTVDGQQRRLDLALALACRPHVLLLDEPTNHLSIALVDELTEALAATDAAVVISTHDRQMLRDAADWPTLALGKP